VPAYISLHDGYPAIPTIVGLILAAMLTPLWMIGVAVVGVIALAVVSAAMTSSLKFVPPLLTSAAFCDFTLALDPNTYSHLSRRRFLWNVLYFVVYAVPMLLLILVILNISFPTLYDVGQSYALPSVAAAVLLRLVARPYGGVLLNSVEVPTLLMVRICARRFCRIASTPAHAIAYDRLAFERYSERLYSSYRRVRTLQNRWSRRAEALTFAVKMELAQNLAVTYREIPLQHLSWLQCWGPGTEAARQRLVEIHHFIVQYSPTFVCQLIGSRGYRAKSHPYDEGNVGPLSG
jgi:hypothetical protein